MNTVKKAQEYIAEKKYSEAKSLLEPLVKQEPNNPDFLLGLGISLLHLADYKSAEKLLLQAAKLDETNPAPHMFLANMHSQASRFNSAIDEYQSAIACQPNIFEAHNYLASIYLSQVNLEDAEYHFKYAISLQPNIADTHANLGQVYEIQHKIKEAKECAETANTLQENHIGALLLLGKISSREKNYELAINYFKSIAEFTNDKTILAMTKIETGHALDRLKKFNEAYEYNIAGKTLWAEISSTIAFDKRQYQNKIASNQAYYTKELCNEWSHSTFSDRPAPIFFVGFPRSGTTLLEQILNQHDKIITSDEKPILQKVIDDISVCLKNSSTPPDDVDGYTTNDIEAIRDFYWKTAKSEVSHLDEDTVLVDKLPLNLIDLGFISRVFPDAKILVALRDPRDVCLSSFMQSFTLNPAMINFLSMQSTIEFYNEVMNLWLHYREALNINYYEYKYEDIVTKFKETTENIFEFLDLQYPDNTADYHLSAKQKIITTPSYQDVTNPVYKRSKERWKNYTSKTDVYNSQLEFLIKTFGYRLG